MTLSTLNHQDRNSIESVWGLRKIVEQTEEIWSESGVPVESIHRVAVMAVIQNPWIDDLVTSDLKTTVREIGPRLARLLTDRINRRLGGPHRVKAFGKGAIIGEAGELEHGAALIHTPYYASLLREFLEGDTVIPFADHRGGAGTTLTVPLGRKNAGPTRDYFQTVNVRLSDGPRPDEIVIVAAASSGTRPFPRAGDRTTDQPLDINALKEVFE